MVDFFAGFGWQLATDIYLPGTTITAFYEKAKTKHDFRSIFSQFREAIDLAYQNTPEDPPVLSLHLHFGNNVKIVAETQILKPEETGSFLASYLLQRK